MLGCDLKLLGCDWLTAVVTLQNLSEVRGRELSVCYEAVAPLYNVIATRHPLYIGPPSPPSVPVKEEEVEEEEEEGGEGSPPKHAPTATETDKEGKPPVSEVESGKGKGEEAKGSSTAITTPPPPPPPPERSGGTPAAKKEVHPKMPAMKFPKSVKTVAV